MFRLLKPWGGWLDAALSFAELTFVGAAMVFTSLLLFANVVLRYLFLAPIPWAEEVTIYLMIWIVFIGGSAIVRLRGHLAIDLLSRTIGSTRRRWLAILVQVLSICFFGTLIYYGGEHTLRVFASGQLTPVLEAPMWLTYLALPAGSSLMLLRSTQLIWLLLTDPDKWSLAVGAIE